MKRFGASSVGALLAFSIVLGVQSQVSAHPRVRTTGPIVKAIVPDHGPTSGGTVVTIKGVNVVGVTSVEFGSTPATNFNVRSQRVITATSPPGVGTVDVVVTTSTGSSPITSADQFTYEDLPTIQGLSPRSGATTGGTKVTISGSGFTGASAVTFGSTPAVSFIVDSDIAITAITPAEGAGKVDVTVTGTGGSSPVDPADEFTFALRFPVVSSVTPNSGPQGGGTQVVIVGSQFMKRGTTVSFGSTPAESFSVLNSKTIMATSPPGSGTVDVTVTDSRGTSSITSGDEFSYS
jgi:hypothetical protein